MVIMSEEDIVKIREEECDVRLPEGRGGDVLRENAVLGRGGCKVNACCCGIEFVR